MPAKRLSMRKIREVLRLRYEVGLGIHQIAASCAVGHTAVAGYLKRAEAAGVRWPLPEGMDDGRLERLLFPPPPLIPSNERFVPPWADVHTELRRKGVTLALLWEEYRAEHPNDSYQYSRFCDLYRAWRGKCDLSMRQEHRSGEKMFVDYCGQTVPVTDSRTGEIREAEIFVAVLGASNYTYAEATWTQSLPDWIASHQRAFAFFNGVTELLIPDNTRCGVSRSCRYEPDLNPTYQDMASHYGIAVIPARVRRPQGKAKVEVGVQIVERWILAALRNRVFFNLAELNGAIDELLERLNARPFRKLPGSRRSQFEALDRPALRPLPAGPYEYAEWKKAAVGIDYHVEIERHYYSVPYQLAGRKLDVRMTPNVIEVFQKGVRVASHCRSYVKGKHTTVPEHMPPSHREYLSWTPERLLRWASKTGPAAARLAEAIMESKSHPQQGFRAILGILRLTKSYGDERVNAACARALMLNALSYRSVESILKNNLDRNSADKTPEPEPIAHPNIRGSLYYSTSGRKEELC
jgi:transposase